MALSVVVDTSVLVAAVRSARGRNREVIRLCLKGVLEPLMGTSLYLEIEDVLRRSELFSTCPISDKDREALFRAFLSVCRWTHVYYLWRPNLADEGDNHILELAVAGGAEIVVTNNMKHLESGELQFPEIKILRPNELVKEME